MSYPSFRTLRSIDKTTSADAVMGENKTVVNTVATKYTAARESSECASARSNTSATPVTTSERIPTINPISRRQPKHRHQR
jgi:hypothetical protein